MMQEATHILTVRSNRIRHQTSQRLEALDEKTVVIPPS